jgi:hypothetical protein
MDHSDTLPEASLDTLLDGDSAPSRTEPEKSQEQEPKAPEPQAPSGEAGKSADPPTGDKTTEAAPPAATQEKTVPVKALEDERRKRQELERRVAEFERAQRPQAQPQQPQAPDIYGDPEGYAAYLRNQYDNGLYETRVVLSQDMMRQQHADYDEVEKVFADYMWQRAEMGDQSLANALRQSANPAKFAYEQGKRIRFMTEIGNDPDGYVERKVQERLASLKTPPGTPQQPEAPAAAPPTSLAGTASAAPPRSGKSNLAEPASLSDLLDT